MKLGLCTIQRDRAPWMVEWLAFHHVVGFRKFYFFAHHCQDDSYALLDKLAKVLEIRAFKIDELMNRVQLGAYQHAYNTFGHEVDWMAFIDGDEFLFPTSDADLRETMEEFSYQRMSALAAYWVCFGSSGHIAEPPGLIIDNYQKRPGLDFLKNRHVKSIVMGRQDMKVDLNAHIFNTQFGTFDERMRPVTRGYMEDTEPSFDKLRINHYTCQSFEYFMDFKKKSGMADAGHLLERADTWWAERDFNDHDDVLICRFRDQASRKPTSCMTPSAHESVRRSCPGRTE